VNTLRVITSLRQVVARLAELLQAPRRKLRLLSGRGKIKADAVSQIGPYTFIIVCRSSGNAGPVGSAAEHVRRAASTMGRKVIPIVAVPYMGEVGRRLCDEAGVAWLDLSGNARIFAPGVRVLIEGRLNRFKRRGRPANPFAPKSSRIARWLLMHSERSVSQRELARSTDVDEGLTSRVVTRLVEDGLLVREAGGGVRPRDPNLLLDAWREAYEFSKHEIVRGHIAARSGGDLLRALAEVLSRRQVAYAVTALAAAWLHARFAGFRLVAVYLPERPSAALVRDIAFREDPRGPNVWLVLPNDEGVFSGVSERDGVRCVHPVQVYLDLKGHPERCLEAAEHLRAQSLRWRKDG
jgi:hypothetical protein